MPTESMANVSEDRGCNGGPTISLLVNNGTSMEVQAPSRHILFGITLHWEMQIKHNLISLHTHLEDFE